MWQCIDELVDIGSFSSLNNFFIWHLPEASSKANIVTYGHVEQDGLLGDHANLRPEPANVQVYEVGVIQVDQAYLRIIETFYQGDNGAFPWATGSHQCQCLSRCNW